MITVPEPLTVSSDQIIELLAWKWSKKENGEYSTWDITTLSAAKMFLNQGYAADFRARSPMLLSVCRKICCVRSIAKSPVENEKPEDVYYPFVDVDMLNEKWEYALFFKIEDIEQHFNFRMIGWTYRSVVNNWTRHEMKVIHRGPFSHQGVRGEFDELMDPSIFYQTVIFPASYPWLIDKMEAKKREEQAQAQKSKEIESKEGPKEIEW